MERNEEQQSPPARQQESNADHPGFGPPPNEEASDRPDSHALDKNEGRMNNGEIGGGLNHGDDNRKPEDTNK